MRTIPLSYWASSGPWIPTSDATCQLWLDPTDNTKITQSSNNVSQWTDKSTNAYTFVQATGAKQPIVTASAINGLQAMAYTATKGLVGPAHKFVSTGAAWTIGLTGKLTYAATHLGVFLIFTDGGGVNPCYQVSFSDSTQSGYVGLDTGQSDSAYAQLLYNATISTNTVFKLIITYSGSSPTSTGSYGIWYNGTSRTVTTNSGGWNAGTDLTGTVVGGLGSGYSTYGNVGFTGDVTFHSSNNTGLTTNLNTYFSRWGA